MLQLRIFASRRRVVRGEVSKQEACAVKARREVHLETSRKPDNIKVTLRARLSRAPPTTVQTEQRTTVVER